MVVGVLQGDGCMQVPALDHQLLLCADAASEGQTGGCIRVLAEQHLAPRTHDHSAVDCDMWQLIKRWYSMCYTWSQQQGHQALKCWRVCRCLGRGVEQQLRKGCNVALPQRCKLLLGHVLHLQRRCASGADKLRHACQRLPLMQCTSCWQSALSDSSMLAGASHSGVRITVNPGCSPAPLAAHAVARGLH